MSLTGTASKLARLMSRKKDIERQIRKLRDQGVKPATPKKPEPTTYDSERKKIMRTTNTEAGRNKALMDLAKKYRRPIKIAGKMFYPPKNIGPPTRGGRTPMKKGGMTKKGYSKGGAAKK